jgi:hypothetical protein
MVSDPANGQRVSPGESYEVFAAVLTGQAT